MNAPRIANRLQDMNVSNVIFIACVLVTKICNPVFSQTNFWQPIGLDTSHVLSIGISSTGYIVVGTTRYRDPTTGTYYGGDLFRSVDEGKSWLKIAPDSLISGPVKVIAITPSDKIFFDGGSKRLYSSNDFGANWTLVNLPYHGGNAYTTRAIVINSFQEIWIALSRTCGWQCGTFGEIFSTQDGGANWSQIWGGASNVPEDLVFDSSGRIFLAVTELGLVGAVHSYVYRSTDGGRHWTFLLNDLIDTFVNSFAVNANDHIFASTYKSGVFRSVDNGETWMQINTGLIYANVQCLAINALEHIFVGTNGGGIFLSEDNGETWIEINAGLTNFKIKTLVCDVSGYLYAGTERGIFRSIKSTTSIKSTVPKMPTSFFLKQNYPNPFNAMTSIEYEVNRRSVVSLTIYDVTGREIQQLVNRTHEPGVYRLRFEGLVLTSGEYYCTMKAEASTQTKHMIVIK